MSKKRTIQILVFVCLLAAGIWVYKMGLVGRYIIVYNAKSNLEQNIGVIRGFKNIQSNNLYLDIEVANNGEAGVDISNSSIDILKKHSISFDSLCHYYSISDDGILIYRHDTIVEQYKEWNVFWGGDSTELKKIGIDFKINLRSIITDMNAANIKYLNGTDGDWTLKFNEGYYVETDCLVGDGLEYPCHYHVGNKKLLETKKFNGWPSYQEYENGIQYGGW